MSVNWPHPLGNLSSVLLILASELISVFFDEFVSDRFAMVQSLCVFLKDFSQNLNYQLQSRRRHFYRWNWLHMVKTREVNSKRCWWTKLKLKNKFSSWKKRTRISVWIFRTRSSSAANFTRSNTKFIFDKTRGSTLPINSFFSCKTAAKPAQKLSLRLASAFITLFARFQPSSTPIYSEISNCKSRLKFFHLKSSKYGFLK